MVQRETILSYPLGTILVDACGQFLCGGANEFIYEIIPYVPSGNQIVL